MIKTNARMDCASRSRMDKSDLFRLVVDPVSGKLTLAEDNKGRGIYLAKNLEAVDRFFAKRLYARYGEPEEGLWERLKSLL